MLEIIEQIMELGMNEMKIKLKKFCLFLAKKKKTL